MGFPAWVKNVIVLKDPLEVTMCLICVEFVRAQMSPFEMRRALGELVRTSAQDVHHEHFRALQELSDEDLVRQVQQAAKSQNIESPE